MRLAVISNQAFSISNFRGPLIRELVRRGVEVYALAPDYDVVQREAVAALGAVPVDYSLERAGMRPLRDLADAARLAVLLRRIRPDASLAYFIKPVIYGSIAARLANVPRRFALVEGAGYVFINEGPLDRRRRTLRAIVSRLYRLALAQVHRAFFLNPDDVALFVTERMVDPDKIVRIDGIGVDLAHYPASPPKTSPLTFVLVARLLAEKGVREFVAAAELVKASHPDARFVVVGGTDPNPSGIGQAEMEAWVAAGIIDWSGQVRDVRPLLREASVFVLPSYYREGVPRSIQEAMAMARPIITTDWVGCRETVEDGVNGFLVPVRDVPALAAAMRRFLSEPGLIASMGLESRRIAEQRFDVHKINGVVLREMGFGP